MKIRSSHIYPSLVILLLVFSTSCFHSRDITGEIADMNQQFMTFYNSGQAAQLSECYTSSARIFPQNREPIEGHEAIVQFWEEIMGRGIKKMELNTIMAEGSGSFAYEEGRYKIYTDSGKEADQGKYMVVWKKEKGQWKMHMAIWNTNHPSSEYRLPDLLL